MGHLVDLPHRRAPARTVEPGHSAAILFFTGVRYYRMEEAEPLQPCAATRPRDGKRGKRAELPTAEMQA